MLAVLWNSFFGVHMIEVVVFILWFSWGKIIDPILISVVVLGRIVTLLTLFGFNCHSW